MQDANDYTIEYETQGIRIVRRIVSYPDIDYYKDYGLFLGIWDAGVAAQWVYMKVNDHIIQELLEKNFEPELLGKVVNAFSRGRFTLDGEPKKKVDGNTHQTIH